jgi:hypothetical protein
MADDINNNKNNSTPYIYNRTTVMDTSNIYMEMP